MVVQLRRLATAVLVVALLGVGGCELGGGSEEADEPGSTQTAASGAAESAAGGAKGPSEPMPTGVDDSADDQDGGAGGPGEPTATPWPTTPTASDRVELARLCGEVRVSGERDADGWPTQATQRRLNAAVWRLGSTMIQVDRVDLATLLIRWADAGDALSVAYTAADATDIAMRRARLRAADTALTQAAEAAGVADCGRLLAG